MARTPEQIIGHDALMQLRFEGFKVVPDGVDHCPGCDGYDCDGCCTYPGVTRDENLPSAADVRGIMADK